jgi:hypothetical protein
MRVSGQRHALAALYPRGKDPRYPLDRRRGWALELVWTQKLEEKFFASVGDRTPVVSLQSKFLNMIATTHCFKNVPGGFLGPWINKHFFPTRRKKLDHNALNVSSIRLQIQFQNHA